MKLLTSVKIKVGEVLAKVPGIKRSDIAWWEQAGYLTPNINKKSRIKRRDYSVEDLGLIQAMWRYRSQGANSQIAYVYALRDLGKGDIPNEVGNVLKQKEDKLGKLFEGIFNGQDLSLEELCLRGYAFLKSLPPNTFQELISYLPIEQTPSGKYRYNPKLIIA